MEFITDKTVENKRLDTALLELLSGSHQKEKYSRAKIQKMIDENTVTVNSKPHKASYKLKEGDIIKIPENGTSENEKSKALLPQDIPLDIVYEDEDLIVLNKQKGILTHPTPLNKEGTLVNALLNYGCNLSSIQGDERRGIVHRLDKNTPGLMLIAKTDEAHINLQKQIQTKSAKRKYLAVVYGIIPEDEGIIDKPLIHSMKKNVKMNVSKSEKGQSALTLYKVLKRCSGLTLLEVELKTGRTHQIRAHMASTGHPVYGDTLYGSKGYRSDIKLKTKEQLLMSYYIKFTHPKTGEIMEFELDKERYDSDFKRFFDIISKEK